MEKYHEIIAAVFTITFWVCVKITMFSNEKRNELKNELKNL